MSILKKIDNYLSCIYKGIPAPGNMYAGKYGDPNGGHGGRKTPILSKYNSSIIDIGGYGYGGYPGIVESIPTPS